jgi:segregation and condensation protein B
MDFKQLKNIVEAALLASAMPMSQARLAALFDEDENIANGDLGKAIEALQADCEGRGVELVEVASGFRYQVRQDVHAWVAKMWTERPSRYSRALLETLALIAYRQPITRGEIESVRGVSVSSSIIKTLEEREWIRVVGHRDVPGRPGLFGTTREFLDYFNLKSLDQLPTLAEIRDLDDLDPQLNFESENGTARAAMPEDPDAADAEADADDADSAQPVAASSDDAPAATDDNASGDEADTTADEVPLADETSPTHATAAEAEAHVDGDDASADPNIEENRA